MRCVLPQLTLLAFCSTAASPSFEQDAVQTPPKRLDASFGLNLRERFESNHAEFLGLLRGDSGEWLLQRLEVRADIRLGGHVQAVVQLQSAFAPGKNVLTPVDRDLLDIEQAFVAVLSNQRQMVFFGFIVVCS